MKPRIHDLTALKHIIYKNKKFLKNKKILGDKGYICNKKNKILTKNNIEIIAQQRKNMSKLKKSHQTLIDKNRIKVENVFSCIKRNYKGASMIYEKKLKTFKSCISIVLGLLF